MNLFRNIPFPKLLNRGVKIHCDSSSTNTENQLITFREMWEDTEQKMKSFKVDFNVFGFENRINHTLFTVQEEKDEDEEKYSWVDELLEKRSSRTEEEDDEAKNKETFETDQATVLRELLNGYLNMV